MPTSLLAVLLLLMTAARADGGGTRVLLQSGVRATDDLGIASFRSPAARSGILTFVGTTSALFMDDRDVVSVVVRTGDPLPPPLHGTFNEVIGSAINDRGTIAFIATLNSPTMASGVFRAQGGNLAALADGGAGDPDINDVGDVVFRHANAITLVRAATGARIAIAARGDPAPGGGTFLRFSGRPVLNDSGSVAFVAEVRDSRRRDVGIFHWDEAAGGRAVAGEGDPSPLGTPFVGLDRRQAVAISPTGAVVFVGGVEGSVVGAFLFEPASGHLRVVAATGDTVDGEVLTDIQDSFVGANARGEVAFVGELGRRRRVVLASASGLTALAPEVSVGRDLPPRLTDAGNVVWVLGGQVVSAGTSPNPIQVRGGGPLSEGFVPDSPDVNDADVTIFRGRREAVYRVTGSGIEVLARVGDEVAAVGALSALGPIAVGKQAIALVSRDANDRRALVVVGPDGLRKIVADGDATPAGARFALEDVAPVVRGFRVLFQAWEIVGETAVHGIFVVNARTGRIRRIASFGLPRTPGVPIHDVGDAAWLGDNIVLRTTLDPQGETSGVVLVRPRRVVKLAATGDVVAGRTLADCGRPTVRGHRVLFWAGLAGSPAGVVLLAWEKGRLWPLFIDAPAAGSGPILVASGPIPVARAAAAFVGAQTAGDVMHRGVFAIRRHRLLPLTFDGDVSPLGGTLLLPEGDVVSAMGGEAVFAADLVGASAARALLAASR
jgi:hypothetical protein